MSDAPMSDAPTLHVLVVDDERPARQRLVDLLNREDDVARVDSVASGRAAVDRIREDAPDVVLLDIQMPGLTGLDVVQEVGPDAMPVVIFVTAFDQHALRAFEANALDYLLKPFEDDRFADALDRARRQVHLESVDRLRDRLLALLDATTGAGSGSGASDGRSAESDAAAPPTANGARTDAPPSGASASDASASAVEGASPNVAAPTPQPPGDDGPLRRIPVRKAREIRVVSVDDVAYFQADGPYVELHMADASMHLIRERMKTLEAQLDARHFCRIHRSTIINLDYVDAVKPNFQDRYVVQLTTGDRLDVSRRRRDRFESRFGLSF